MYMVYVTTHGHIFSAQIYWILCSYCIGSNQIFPNDMFYGYDKVNNSMWTQIKHLNHVTPNSEVIDNNRGAASIITLLLASIWKLLVCKMYWNVFLVHRYK